VFGFKSFADKLNLEFEDGITAIVGPNGCGKSNVADSIRWALGEQSAKSLRGSNMQDVIFTGTESRKSLSFCEVSLHFDNTAKIFDSEFNDVVISRKLYRSGDSEYLINKTPVRYRDVGAILHNTGLGKNSYSIIGQGRIDSILSAKPADRRGIFEDAAGISKYKEVKIENERKLVRVKEKLVRSGDIISELEKQLEPLRRQADDARRCFEVQEKLKFYDVNNYVVQYESVQDKRDVINARVKGIEEEYDLKQTEFDAVYDEYQAIMESFNSIDREYEVLNEERFLLIRELEKHTGEINLLKEKVEHLKGQSLRLKQEVAKDNAEFEENTRRLSDLEEDIAAKQKQGDNLKKSIESVNGRYLEVVQILKRGEDDVESAHQEAVNSMAKLSETKADMARLAAEKDSAAERVKEFSKRVDALSAKITDDEIKIILANGEIEKSQKERDRFSGLGAQKAALFAQANQNIQKFAAEIDKLNTEYHSKKTRQKMLSDMNKEMQGYAYSVKMLLKDAAIKPELSRRIEGTVAQLIKVKAEYEVALEMALGAALQNIVTGTEEDAKFLISHLKANNYGRATFMPLSSIKGRMLDASADKYLKLKGVIGVASDLCGFDKKYTDIIFNLLGRTVVVDTYDNAVAVARQSSYSFRIVTKDGEIFSPQGTITGGSKKSEIANFLSQERELDEAMAEVIRLEKSLAEITRKRSSEAEALDKISAEMKKLNDSVHAFDVMLAAENEKLQEIVKSVNACREEIKQLEAERTKTAAREKEITKAISECVGFEKTIADKRREAVDYNQKNQKQFEEVKAERDRLWAELTDLKVKQAAADSAATAERGEIARLKNEIAALLETIEENNVQIDKNEQTFAAVDLSLIEDGSLADSGMAERLNTIAAELSGMSAKKLEFQNKLLALEQDKQQYQTELTAIAEKKFLERNELTKIDSSMQYYHEKITEEYKMTYEDCLIFKEADYNYNRGVAEANRLKRELGRFGPINANALEDYTRVKERYDAEALQKADLDKSIIDIKKIIKEMTIEMLTRFNAQFELIRANFTRVFKELFGGGKADLMIEEAEDQLEAGIEIVAEPPGKKLQSISLLSGGERALTAIAILFAILKLRPMPFCVLDEIEAALDDANAERFAKYLRKFSEKTQFIVITHRKPTMELADSLYGVTMEEKGVSKIVSVKLSDAIKNVAVAAGS